MSERLRGRRVVLTEADQFMGPDIAALFREEGADLLADVSDLRVQGACEALIAAAGRVDVLMINLAGKASGRPAEEIAESELDELFDRMVRPLHRLIRATLPAMKARRSGKIVVVGSASALKGVAGRAAYATARAAQHGYVRTAGTEAAPYGVNINATAQVFVENPTYFSSEYQATEEFRRRMLSVPAGRLATGREAALFLLALAGAESDWIFGQVFPYAGGWVA